MNDLENGAKAQETQEAAGEETQEEVKEITQGITEETSDTGGRKRQYRKGLLHGALLSFLLIILFLIGMIAVLLHYGALRIENSAGVTATDSSGNSTTLLTDEQWDKVALLYSYVQKYYVDDVDTETMADSIYHAILEGTGDSYTDYFSAEELTSYTNYSDNSYYGIGVGFYVDEEGYAIISEVYTDSPALEAGIEAGDLLLEVSGQSVFGWEAEDISALIRGEEGTTVNMVLERNGETYSVDVERRNVILDTVGYTVIDNIGYIYVTKFGSRTASEFEDALAVLEEENVQGIIIDLRNNSGGHVSAVTEMMDAIFGEATTLTMTSSSGDNYVYVSDEEHKVDVPVVVVVNEKSASASEIFAAAAQELQVGALVGTTTYGKGVYQNIFYLKDGSAVKITVGKFYSPNGNNFNGVGITPDYEVEYEYLEDAELVYGYEADSQLAKAFEVMRELIAADASGDAN